MEASTDVLEVLGPETALVLPTVDALPLELPPLADAPPNVLPPVLRVLPPLLEVLAPVVELPPLAVLLVFPPLIVPVVVFVEFWFVCAVFVGLIVRSDAFEAADVPLRLLVLTVPDAEDGLEVSPVVWFVTAQEVEVAGQS